jgi:4-hydroxyphenylacetate 3-monooxygenase
MLIASPGHTSCPHDHGTRSNDEWIADDRRKLLSFARDLLNPEYARHRLTFQFFARCAPFAHRVAVYRSFNVDA